MGTISLLPQSSKRPAGPKSSATQPMLASSSAPAGTGSRSRTAKVRTWLAPQASEAPKLTRQVDPALRSGVQLQPGPEAAGSNRVPVGTVSVMTGWSDGMQPGWSAFSTFRA